MMMASQCAVVALADSAADMRPECGGIPIFAQPLVHSGDCIFATPMNHPADES